MAFAARTTKKANRCFFLCVQAELISFLHNFSFSMHNIKTKIAMFQYIVGAAHFLVRSCFKQYPCRKKPQLCQKIVAKEQRSDSDSDSMKKIGDLSFGVCSQFFRLVLLWVKKNPYASNCSTPHNHFIYLRRCWRCRI